MLFICLFFSFGCATPPSQSQKQAYFGSVADIDPLEPLNRPVTGLIRASNTGRSELTDAVIEVSIGNRAAMRLAMATGPVLLYRPPLTTFRARPVPWEAPRFQGIRELRD